MMSSAQAKNEPLNCAEAYMMRTLNAPSSSIGLEFSCKPGGGNLSIRDLSRNVVSDNSINREKPKKLSSTITATLKENGQVVQVCQYPNDVDQGHCAQYSAATILHYAQSKNYCGRDADLIFKTEIIDYKDPAITFPQGSLLPIPHPSFGESIQKLYENAKQACLIDDITSKKKKEKKAQKEIEEKHNAFVSSCVAANDAFWVAVDEKMGTDCADFLIQKTKSVLGGEDLKGSKESGQKAKPEEAQSSGSSTPNETKKDPATQVD